MNEQFKTFEDLECWQACTELRRFISKFIQEFPKEEKFSLVSQMRRASRSATNNIAEGYGRFHYKENAQFCRQSRGSLYELIDDFIIAVDEGYISKEEYQQGRELLQKSIAILNGYINYLIKVNKQPKDTINL